MIIKHKSSCHHAQPDHAPCACICNCERDYRPTPKRLIIGPVKATFQMVYDQEGDRILDVRGWGRLQYYKDGDKLQDKITAWIVEAINEKLERDPI